MCFPFAPTANALTKKETTEHLQSLHKSLQYIRFEATEAALEEKEKRRQLHDKHRATVPSARESQRFIPGTIVCVHRPTPKLKKLTYQWTPPNHVVVEVDTNVCKVRPLSKGGKVKDVESAGGIPLTTVNRKMLKPFPVPLSYFIGAKVCRRFGEEWVVGTVTSVDDDDGENIWHVVYRDFDEEDLNLGELAKVLLYHPGLGTADEVQLPEVGTFVWFAWEQRPRLGLVESVDPSVPRPLQVRCYAPVRGDPDITKERFQPAFGDDDQPLTQHLSAHQVMLTVERLTPRGYLPAKARRQLAKALAV